MAEFLRRHAGAFAELLGKGALIAKRVLDGDLDDGQRCFGPCFCGGLDAGAQQQLIRAEVECDAEFAMKVTLDAGPSAYSELAVLPDGTVLNQDEWIKQVCKTIKDDTVNGGYQAGCTAGAFAPF